MVIGIIADNSTAEILLNNLSEADFKLKNVSVIMRDVKARNAITRDRGPFKGITFETLLDKLTKIGLSPTDAKPYVDAVTAGKAFVALAGPVGSEPAAAEMFHDVNGDLIRTVDTNEQKPKPPVPAA